MEKHVMEDVLELTKKLIHQYCKGKPENWFSYLAPRSVFVSTGEGMLIGAENIKARFQKYAKKGRGKIYREEYSHIPISKKSAIVYAEVVTGKQNNNDYRIINSYTFVYQMIRGETKIIYEHTSYEYFSEKESLESKTLSMDMYTFQFVKHLLLENTRQERLCITSGSQTLYLDINTLLYIQGDRHNTLLYCIDKQITCSKTLQELKEELPDDFYQIHRSYLINTKYLTSLCCYEAELISGIKIPIPAASYGKVKRELEEKLKRPLRKKKK